MAITATVEEIYSADLAAIKVVFPSFDTAPVMRPVLFTNDFLAKRMKVVKDQGVFWATLITSDNTNDFSKVNIFHHPSPNQHKDKQKRPDAPDSAYETFGGGWRALEMAYGQAMGVQHAASSVSFPLLIPLMRMSAFNSPSPANHIFAAEPVETLNAIMTAAAGTAVTMGNELSTSSFSNGIIFQAATMAFLIARVTYCVDYDSSFIKGKARDIGPSAGRIIVRYSQNKTVAPCSQNYFLPDPRWPSDMRLHGAPLNGTQIHHLICTHCHTDAMNSGPIL